MRDFTRAHRVEVAVGLFSTAICLFFVIPFVMKQFEARPGTKIPGAAIVRKEVPIGPGTIYARTSHEPLFTGDTPLDAMETRVSEIRALLKSEGLEPLSMSCRELEVTLKQSWSAGDIAPISFFRSMDRADLSGLALQGLDLRGMSLRGCVFRGTNLTGAQLSGAVLRYSNMRGINLSNVDLREVSLRWPIEAGIFRGSNLEGRRVKQCRGCDFSGANLRGTQIEISGNANTQFSGADMRGATLTVVEHRSTLPIDKDGVRFRVEHPSACYRRIQFDETTQTEGLRLTGVVDTAAPFVLWALKHGAVLSEGT
jgi:hypothetical protein